MTDEENKNYTTITEEAESCKRQRAWNSIRSWYSIFSILCSFSVMSALCANAMFSLLSVNALFSLLSVNSMFSILSVNSYMAIGCSGESFKHCYTD